MKKLTFILIGLMALSCQDIENCGTDDNLDFMVVGFFNYETQAAQKVGFSITADDSPYQFTLAEDSLSIGLPLNPNDTLSTFYFETDTSRYELTMRYDPQLSVFDPTCDPSIIFLGLDTVSYSFDSLSIPGTVTNRQISINVEVYF